MAKFKPGKYFPMGALEKLNDVRLDGGWIVTDSCCEEVMNIVREEVNADFRDLVLSFSLILTATVLGILGVFWRTYTVVDGEIVPIGIITYVLSFGISAVIGIRKRKEFLAELVKECEDR